MKRISYKLVMHDGSYPAVYRKGWIFWHFKGYHQEGLSIELFINRDSEYPKRIDVIKTKPHEHKWKMSRHIYGLRKCSCGAQEWLMNNGKWRCMEN